LIIRLVLGITIVYFGYRRLVGRNKNSGMNNMLYGFAQILVAIFILIGLYTQLAALIIAIVLIVQLVLKAKNKELFTDGVNYYVLLLVMAISLMATGAGKMAFDMPL